MSLRRVLASLTAFLILPTLSANAQTIGTFRWQLQPYCNVFTLTVTQQGAIYTLDGTDDRCGGGNQAGSAVGIAYLTPLGLVGFGITSVLPNGTPVHTEATISLANLGGTWRDSAGNNGSMVFTPGAPVAGAPRPVATTGIAPASITNVQIANNTITSANILNGSIATADLADPPRGAFASGDQTIALTTTSVVVRAVTLAAPGNGRVIVNASGYFTHNDNAATDSGRCSLTTGTTLDFDHLTLSTESANITLLRIPFALTRGFNVTAGNFTVNLVCDEFSGNVEISDTSVTAVYVPGS